MKRLLMILVIACALIGTASASQWLDNYDLLKSATATGTMFHVVDKPVRYIRAEYVSKSGGDATTAVSVKCSAVAR